MGYLPPGPVTKVGNTPYGATPPFLPPGKQPHPRPSAPCWGPRYTSASSLPPPAHAANVGAPSDQDALLSAETGPANTLVSDFGLQSWERINTCGPICAVCYAGGWGWGGGQTGREAAASRQRIPCPSRPGVCPPPVPAAGCARARREAPCCGE